MGPLLALAAAPFLPLVVPQDPLPVQAQAVPGPWVSPNGAVLGGPRGEVWIVGHRLPSDTIRIERRTASGDSLWTHDVQDPVAPSPIGPDPLAIRPDLAGGAFVGMSVEEAVGGSTDGLVLHLAGDGTLLWSTTIDVPGAGVRLFDLISDGAGGLYFAASGSYASGAGLLIGRLLSDGTLDWTRQVVSASGALAGGGLAVDSVGDLVWIGHVDSSSVTAFQRRSWSPDGTPVAIAHVGGSAWSIASRIVCVAADASGQVLIGGRNDLGLAQVSAVEVDGSLAWNVTIGAQSGWVDAIEREVGGDWWVSHGRSALPANEAWLSSLTPGGQVAGSTRLPGVTGDVVGLDVDPYGSAWVSVLAPRDTNFQYPEFGVVRLVTRPSSDPTCAGRPNSTGASAFAAAVGSSLLSDDDTTLFATDLPVGVFGFFVVAPAGGFVPNPGGSQGDLCLSGAIGRLNRPDEIFLSDAAGRASLVLDPSDVPSGLGGTFAIAAGETWHFQAWYRDADPGPTSNFTAAFSLSLQ